MRRHFALTGLTLCLLLSACGGAENTPQSGNVQPLDIRTGRFVASVTGSAEYVLGGTATITRQPEGGYLVAMKSEVPGTQEIEISLTLPESLVENISTPVVSYFSAISLDNEIDAVGASFSQPLNDTISLYATVESGQITVQTLNPMVASFDFSASNGQGGLVQVTGSLE